jgi:hypothetical protein
MLIRILNAIYNFLHEFGKARAAAHFARHGDYNTARAIMEAK